MKFKELREKVKQGYNPVVRFKDSVSELETYLEGNMMARLVNVSDDYGDHGGFVFSVKEFDDHNAEFETANYYDNNGNPCLTAREAGLHPERDHMNETLYLMYSDDVNSFMELVSNDGTELFGQYESLPRGDMTYVQWLENRVKELEKKIL